MNGKHALNKLFENLSCEHCECRDICIANDEIPAECEIWHQSVLKDLNGLEILEKELKRTKRNFKNSQIHSKNCYKKLKEKFIYYKNFYDNSIEKFDELYTTVDYYERKIFDLKQAIKIFVGYLVACDKTSFDTFITSQCTDEEQEICKRAFKEVLEDEM